MNTLKISIITLGSLFMLTGCFDSNKTYKDIDDWMIKTKKAQIGNIKPLPAAKEFNPVEFRNPVDPFQERQVLTVFNNDRFAPDFNRRKEPLEEYPLEKLRMTGVVINDGKISAMIMTPENKVHYISKGNYMGLNFGEVINIDEASIRLEERIKDSREVWVIKNVTVYLSEQDSRK